MPRIRTKATHPSPDEMAEVRRGFSLYRSVHFYERKSGAELETTAEHATESRVLVPSSKVIRLQAQVGAPVTFYRGIMRRGE